MSISYIVIADSARARLYSFDHSTELLTSIEDLVHPQSRKRERELDSDRQGRYTSSFASFHHGVGREDKSHLHERGVFAAQIAETLESAHEHQLFDDLILIANPKFLGELRDHLSKNCLSLVSHTLSRNLVAASIDEIIERLPLSVVNRKAN